MKNVYSIHIITAIWTFKLLSTVEEKDQIYLAALAKIQRYLTITLPRNIEKTATSPILKVGPMYYFLGFSVSA